MFETMFVWILITMMVLLLVGSAKIIITSSYQLYNKFFRAVPGEKRMPLTKSIEV